jgi:hypothetical protein
MKTIFNLISIDKVQYNYFSQLSPADKLFYLFDVYEMYGVNKTKAIDLTEFFTGVQDSLEYEINVSQDVFPDNVDRVDVMIDDQNIMIESNKLSAIRHIVSKFMESGYLISRDIDTEKMFKKDKLTRYMRIFKIISRGSTICLN